MLRHVAKEQYRLSSEALYEYLLANIDVRSEKPQLQVDGRAIEDYDHPLT